MRLGILSRDKACSIRSPIGMMVPTGAVVDTLMRRPGGEREGHLGVEADRYSV